MIDRLAPLARPAGLPLGHQTWASVLFLHRAVPVEALRPLVPAPLEIDTYDGSAWLGLVPFTIRGMRPVFAPPLPVLSRSHELNVRTYVHYGGVPGVWFFSLDAANPALVAGGRAGLSLPYYRARQALDRDGERITFRSRRIHPGAPPAAFEARWRVGAPLPPSDPSSLAFFLTERYCLYALRRGRLYRTRVAHPAWPLRSAALEVYRSTLARAAGLPEADGTPLVHYADGVAVQAWRPQRVDGRGRHRAAQA